MKYKTGVICGAFDLIHPGYIYMFQEAKTICHELVVLLDQDPSFSRPGKLKPILSLHDRSRILSSIKYIDKIVWYQSEPYLAITLQALDYQVRFLGSDYIGKNYIKDDKDIPVVYLSREHDWSTTKLIKLIIERGLPNGDSKEIPS